MVTFNIFVKRFGGLKKFVDKRAKEIILSRSEEIIKMQQDQHHAGVNVKGEQMQGGYSSGYTKSRKKKGLQTRFVDLHFSGRFHKGLKVVPVKEGVDIRSDVDYEKYLRGNFPGEAGLTTQNTTVIAEFVANILAVDIKKYLVA